MITPSSAADPLLFRAVIYSPGPIPFSTLAGFFRNRMWMRFLWGVLSILPAERTVFSFRGPFHRLCYAEIHIMSRFLESHEKVTSLWQTAGETNKGSNDPYCPSPVIYRAATVCLLFRGPIRWPQRRGPQPIPVRPGFRCCWAWWPLQRICRKGPLNTT